MRKAFVSLLLFAASPLAAQDAPPPQTAAASPPASDDAGIVVKGTREEVRHELWQILDTTEGHYARFDSAFCPKVIGFDREWTPILENLIRQNAERAGLRPAAEPCTPTAIVFFIDQPQALMQGLLKRYPTLFTGDYTYPSATRRMIAEKQPYYAWRLVVLRSVDGVESRDHHVRVVATRLASGVRYDVVDSYLVMDITKTPGMTLGQIADFATLQLLTQIVPDSVAASRPDSMLRLFEVADPTTLPARMNAFDRGMLAGLYDANFRDVPGNMQRSKLSRSIIEQMRADGEPVVEK
jgi:hypothetical protein